MSRVMLCGYYGFDNLGDTALLYSIITAIRQHLPATQLVVMSNRPQQTASQYQVETVNRWHIPSVWQALGRCDALVMGGGSLLQDITGLKSLLYYLGIIEMAHLKGVPVFFYAQGIGPIKTLSGRLLTRQVVNRVAAITVRDEDSITELAALGVKRPPIKPCSDPVLGLTISPDQINSQRQLLKSRGVDIDRPLIGISVRHWSNWDNIKKEVAHTADLLSQVGYSICFIPMQPPGDEEASQEVAALMVNPAPVLDKVNEVADIAGIIANCDLIIGIRLHALILAATAGVPLVGISYDPKIDAFLQQIRQTPAMSTHSPRHSDLLAAANHLLGDLENARSELAQAVAPLRTQAHLPLTILQSILK
ncbi:MAG: polysaccharide pyruvyl transferase CsaB [Methylocystaceae bacterium]